MAAVRRENTPPELALRKELHRHGLRYRLHVKNLPGSPDIVLPKYKSLIFVHGCFWHRHFGCKLTTTPKTNEEFWKKKFENNTNRDIIKEQALKDMGWHVFVVWQCELSSTAKAAEAARRLAQEIKSSQ